LSSITCHNTSGSELPFSKLADAGHSAAPGDSSQWWPLLTHCV